MTTPTFKELALEKYARLLATVHGGSGALAFCDLEGTLVWCEGGVAGDRLARAIRELSEQGWVWEPGGSAAVRCRIGSSRTLLGCPVGPPNAPVAWLVTLAGDAGPGGSEREDRLAEMLSHASACVAQECRLTEEIHGLASELSDRYEELNLIYSLKGHELDETGASIPEFLRGFAELISVDVAAFVTSTRRVPVYAADPIQPIDKLDLVLVATRGDLFRFVSASRKTFVMNSPDDPRRRFLMTNMPFKVLACPVGRGGTDPRMLVLLRRWERPDFSSSDRNLATVVADQAALLIDNEAMVGRLRRFGEQTVGALIEAVEAKDPYTRGHSERVQMISVELGRALGLDGLDLEDVFWGSIFHDVGKLGVPDAILCKPGHLTPDEYAFIKIHPERSYEILRHIEYLRKNALDGARHHHERFDGNGYPHGLGGRTIPMHARIIAVADTYDAITTSRSYRAGRSHDEAMAEIQRVAGSQLDPEVVGTFEQMCAAGPSWPDECGFPGWRGDA